MTTTISTSSKVSLSNVIERVRAYAQDCTDDYTQSQELRFDTTGHMLFPSRSSKYTEKIATTPNDHAWSQLIEKLDAPAKAWVMNNERCPVELRAKIFNNLAKEYRPNSEVLIRMKGNNTRAVLSNKYTKYDNLDMITTVDKICSQNNLTVDVYRPEVGDFMCAYILLPSITFDQDTNKGGGLHPGVYISNGETGQSATRTAGGLYRSLCSNGAIIGWNKDQDNSLKMVHRYHDTYTFTRIIAAGILSGLQMSETAGAAYLASIELPAGDTTEISKLVNRWSDNYGITLSVKDDWLKAVTGEAIENGRTKDTAHIVDVFNAATSTARSIDNPEEREIVERMAGDYLMHSTRQSTQTQRLTSAVQTITRPGYDFSQWRVAS